MGSGYVPALVEPVSLEKVDLVTVARLLQLFPLVICPSLPPLVTYCSE